MGDEDGIWVSVLVMVDRKDGGIFPICCTVSDPIHRFANQAVVEVDLHLGV